MQPLSIKRIVVGTDFSEGSDAAMATAFAFALANNAVVDLVHVLEPGVLFAPVSLGAMPLADGPALFEEIDRALAFRADEAQRTGLVCHTDSLQGFPPSEIVRHAPRRRARISSSSGLTAARGSRTPFSGASPSASSSARAVPCWSSRKRGARTDASKWRSLGPVCYLP